MAESKRFIRAIGKWAKGAKWEWEWVKELLKHTNGSRVKQPMSRPLDRYRFIQLLANSSCERGVRRRQWWSGMLGWYAQDGLGRGIDHPICVSQRTEAIPLSRRQMSVSLVRYQEMDGD